MVARVMMALLVQAAQPAPAPTPIPAPSPTPPATATVTDPRLPRMATLYDELCLKAFPDDAAMDRYMAGRGATPLTPEQVRVTLVDDPGRGWALRDEGATVLVFLELPPYHACSVRWPAPAGTPDWSAYNAIAAAYTARTSGWTTMPPIAMDRGAIHVTGTLTGRMLPSGGAESLMVIDQTITDPTRRAAGETGVERRFVHQIKEG